MFYTLFLLQGDPQGTQSTFTATWTHGRGTKGPFRLRPICLQHCDNTNLKTAAQTYSMADQQFFYCHFTKLHWFNLSGIRSQKWAVTAFVWNSATESAIPTGCNDIKEIHGQRYDLLVSPHRRKRAVFVPVERYEREKTIRQSFNVAFRLIGQKCLQRRADWLTLGRPSYPSSIWQ